MKDAVFRSIPLFPRRPAGSLADSLCNDYRFEIGATLGDLDVSVCLNPCVELCEDGDPEYFLVVCGPSVERYFDLWRRQDGSFTGRLGAFRTYVHPFDEWSSPSHVLVLLEERLPDEAVPLDWETLRWRLAYEPGGEVPGWELRG